MDRQAPQRCESHVAQLAPVDDLPQVVLHNAEVDVSQLSEGLRVRCDILVLRGEFQAQEGLLRIVAVAKKVEVQESLVITACPKTVVLIGDINPQLTSWLVARCSISKT